MNESRRIEMLKKLAVRLNGITAGEFQLLLDMDNDELTDFVTERC